MYTLFYDNGTGWFDAASRHVTLAAAIAAARRDWQHRQHITGPDNKVVWADYSRPDLTKDPRTGAWVKV